MEQQCQIFFLMGGAKASILTGLEMVSVMMITITHPASMIKEIAAIQMQVMSSAQYASAWILFTQCHPMQSATILYGLEMMFVMMKLTMLFVCLMVGIVANPILTMCFAKCVAALN